MVTALVSLLVLGFLVVVHESGHFVVARWCGVRVLRFSMGFGPRLLTWRRGDTEYAVSAIPLGGYVKMAGEQRSEQSHQPWEYLSKPIGTRATIVFAGPFVNYLVALVSLWFVFLIGFPELMPVVGKVIEGMPAQAAGIQTGDRIQAVEGHPVQTWDEMTKLIYQSPERPLLFQVRRGEVVQTMTMTPKAKAVIDPFGRPTIVGQIGIAPSGDFRAYRVGPLAAVGRTIQEQNRWLAITALGFWSMLSRKLPLRESVTGPIGIVSLIADAVKELLGAVKASVRERGLAFLASEDVRLGFSRLVLFTSFIGFCLSIFNLLPIPILDGGHLFFLAVEKLRGRPVSVTVQERSAQVSLALLVAFALLVCVNDVSRLGLLEKMTGWVRR